MALKHVVYYDRLQDSVAERMLLERPDFRVSRLSYASPEAQNYRAMTGAHGYFITAARDEVPLPYQGTRELFEHCPNLLVLASTGAGYDTIDLDACTAAGIAAINQAGGNAEGVAEHVLAMLLALSKNLGIADRRMRSERIFDRAGLIGRNLQGKTVGIIGLGHVGRRVAALCRGLFGCRVLAYDPYLSAQQFAERGAEPAAFDDLLRQADYVSINCPRTRETTGMLDARAFGLMKQGAFFVTTARGGIHNEAALHAALVSGHLAGAGLDVWAKEPPELDHPLLALDNVIASPHIAGVTHESRYEIAVLAGRQMIEIFQGRKPDRLLNPEVWERWLKRYEQMFGRLPAG
ncbi:MAG: hydroxyacid dehydrogenase [Alphaproteobacteria bacterium]|nr:hydroxyacid dehydrogenase [Alphaproteobacteria bacterium]